MKTRRQKYGRMRKRTRNRKSSAFRRRLQSKRKQQHHKQQHRFKQSGGDLLNYLPSDISMTMRSAAHSMGSAFSGIKGMMPSSNPLPFNDHHLQKETVSITDRLPNLQQYYKNANSMIPAL
jgi:hypothetical protein